MSRNNINNFSVFKSPWFVLFVLTMVNSVGFIDRQLINLLVQPIKSDFILTDVEISLLQGIAFSLTYLLFSPLFGRWVDVAIRRNILLGCVSLWSLFTALCGFTRGFTELFAARSLVGATEAGLSPSTYSLLSDTFTDRQLTTAMSIYTLGPYIGGGFSLLLGGAVLHAVAGWDLTGVPILEHLAPWQLTLFTLGLCGLVAAALLLLVREPKRGAIIQGDDFKISLRDSSRILQENRGFYGLFYVGKALALVPIYAFPAWFPALATREFGIPIPQVGFTYGLVVLIFGSIGVLSGPSVARLLKHMGYRDANIRISVYSAFGVIGACALLYVRSSYAMGLAAGAMATFFYSLPQGATAAALQSVTPNRMRGLVTSIFVVIVTLVGLGVAPLLVALLTDYLFRDEVRVGDSLAIVCFMTATISMITLYKCLAHYRGLLDVPIVARSTTTPVASPATEMR